MMNVKSKSLWTVGLGALILAGGVVITQASYAQPASDIGLEQIVVSGSRIVRPGFESPTPITSFGEADLASRGYVNMGQVFSDLPMVRPEVSSAGQPVAVGSANVNLRALGANRTLVLLDSRRIAPTNSNGGVDINILPASLINRIGLVTGGASAAYGSDAVSGVANVFIGSTLDGTKGTLQYGHTQYGDARTYSASVAHGLGFGNERGRFVIAGDVFKDGGAIRTDREWGSKGWAIITSAPGQPGLPISQNVKFSNISDGGVITNATGPAAVLRNIQFGVGGVPMTFNRGTNVASVFMTGGDGSYFGNDAAIANKGNRRSAFSRVTYDLTDSLKYAGTASDHKFEKRAKAILEALAAPEKFEEGQRQLGELLGFVAGNDDGDAAPDPWWLGETIGVVFEDHANGKTTTVFGANKAKQAALHPDWLEENVPDAKGLKIVAVVVTPCSSAGKGAKPALKKVRYWSLEEFKVWATDAIDVVRGLKTALPPGGDLFWRLSAADKRISSGLTLETIIDRLPLASNEIAIV